MRFVEIIPARTRSLLSVIAVARPVRVIDRESWRCISLSQIISAHASFSATHGFLQQSIGSIRKEPFMCLSACGHIQIGLSVSAVSADQGWLS
jgi:hypothetical protein